MSKYKDIKPAILNNFFTPAEYGDLYRQIVDAYSKEKTVIPDTGYFAVGGFIKPNIKDILISKMKEATKDDIMYVDVHYARYTLETGYKPILAPHFDRGLEYASYTFTIVLDTTLDWPISVEGVEFNPRRNDAILFSGSHHVHWRPHIEFKEKDYYDIIVCQFVDNKPLHLTKEFKDDMDNNFVKYVRQWEEEFGSIDLAGGKYEH